MDLQEYLIESIFDDDNVLCKKMTKADGLTDSDIHIRGKLNPPPGITYSNLPKGWTYVTLG